MAVQFIDLLPAIAVLTDPTRSVNLAQVAALVGLSPSRVQRVVSGVVDQSPKQLDRAARLDLGAILLMSTEDRVIDVAMATGFDSHEGFTRAFGDRFGQSPTLWRRQRRQILSPAEADLAKSTSRCIRLHHRQLIRKESSVTYEIQVETLGAVPVLYQQRKVDRDQLGSVLAEVLPAVFTYVMETGLAPAGHPFVRYGTATPAYVTIDAGIPLVEAATSPPPQDSGIMVGELPAGPAAVTTHRGPYEDLGTAHAAVDRWIHNSEHSSGGDPWEIYLTDPGEVPDPADWLTKVCWPLG